MLLFAANISCIFDDETEELVNNISRKLCLKHNNHQPIPKVYIINDTTPNAAISSEGCLILYSGMIARCKNFNEFAGVIAHELGHFKARHANINIQSASPVAFGAGLGTVALAPPLGLMFLALGMQINTQETLKQMRAHEKQADNEAVRILKSVNWPSDGLFTFLKSIEPYSDRSIHVYFRTHPTSQERLSNLESKITKDGSIPEDFKKSFERIQNKIRGFIYKEDRHNNKIANIMKNIAKRNYDTALSLSEKLLQQSPNDAYYLEIKADALYALGRLEEAKKNFLRAYQQKPNSVYIPMKYAIALIDTNNYDEAIKVLNKTSMNMPDMAYTWRLLGSAYHKKNMPGNAEVCLLEEARISEDKDKIKYLLKRKITPETAIFKQRLKDLQSLKS